MVHDKQPLTIVVMAGGTGGHIFPALATATELQARGYCIHWLGTPGSMEAEIVPRYGFDISFIPVTGLRGKKLETLFKAPWRLVCSLMKAIVMLKQKKPICVLGMGGYVTGPGGVAARLLGIPLVIHEQNAVPGLTNKLLSKVATRVLEAFPGTFPVSPDNRRIKRKVFTTGNPVRSTLALSSDYQAGKPLKLLVLGGSRGAVAINQVIPPLFAGCKGNLDVWHQTGKHNIAATLSAYKAQNMTEKPYKVESFIDDMAAAYYWADIVLCRSGALTVSELAVAGRPAILVPYPHAVDDHQSVNGRYLVDEGAALMIQQKDLDANMLITLLTGLGNDPSRLAAMAASAKAVGKAQATCDVAEHCLEVSNG